MTNEAIFIQYHEGEFWYMDSEGFAFPVPLNELGGRRLMATESLENLDPWIQRHRREVVTLREASRNARDAVFYLSWQRYFERS